MCSNTNLLPNDDGCPHYLFDRTTIMGTATIILYEQYFHFYLLVFKDKLRTSGPQSQFLPYLHIRSVSIFLIFQLNHSQPLIGALKLIFTPLPSRTDPRIMVGVENALPQFPSVSITMTPPRPSTFLAKYSMPFFAASSALTFSCRIISEIVFARTVLIKCSPTPVADTAQVSLSA